MWLAQTNSFCRYNCSQVSDQRRNARRVAKTLFYAADEDGSGFLDKAEVAEVAIKLQKKYPEVYPIFNIISSFGSYQLAASVIGTRTEWCNCANSVRSVRW
eukprot:SAG31_NODE_156_length_22055_cov_105.227728_5_plen_101_part_00